MVRERLMAMRVGSPFLDVPAEMASKALLSVRNDVLVETGQVIAEVGSDDGRFETVAVVVEDVRVPVPVPAGDAVRSEQIQDGVGVVLPAHQDPHVDFVLAHRRQKVSFHLSSFGLPLPPVALSCATDLRVRGVYRNCQEH
jgi:hypothetical protein